MKSNFLFLRVIVCLAFFMPHFTATISGKENSAVNNRIQTISAGTQRDGSDLATARIATLTGTTSETFIEKEYPQAQLLRFDNMSDVILAVISGKADYALTSYVTSLLAIKNNRNLVMLPEKYIEDPAGIAINKKDTVLLHQINEIILKYKKDGTLRDIINRWIKEDGSDYQPLEIPALEQGTPLKVGITASREPMCFVSNGQITGLDIELIERIAYELGYRVEYYDMNFSGLIAAIESGRVDIVISNFSVTPERLMRVNFSESYFVNPQVLTTLAAGTMFEQTAGKNRISKIRESFFNNIVAEKRYLLIINGLKQTVIITFFSIIFGTITGALICFLRMSRRKLVSGFAKIYINVMRGTPVLVLLMILFYVIFATTKLSAAAIAVIAFSLNMGAYSSEIFRTAIQRIDAGQREAGIALGFTKIQTFIYIIFPQALKSIIPVYNGEIVSLLKMTSIVGYIAVIDLTKASDIIRSRTFDAFFPLIIVAAIYFLLAWLLGAMLGMFNQKRISAK